VCVFGCGVVGSPPKPKPPKPQSPIPNPQSPMFLMHEFKYIFIKKTNYGK